MDGGKKKKKAKTSCSCFGFSVSSTRQNATGESQPLPPDKLKSDEQTSKRTYRFSWLQKSSSIIKSTTKTVPVIEANSSTSSHSGSTFEGNKLATPTLPRLDHDQPLGSAATAAGGQVSTACVGNDQMEILTKKEGPKNNDYKKIIMDNNSKRRTHLDAEKIATAPATTTPPCMTHTTRTSSPPQTEHEKTKTVENMAEGVAAKLDYLLGMSIVIISLVIMVVWGKFCAILCTCTWLYIAPRFRSAATSATQQAESNKNDSDVISSEEYKERVVLEGFLRRNNRNVV